jgi:NADPH-dependent 7-cyano-7-deazaguanine reductase QueF
MSLCGEKELHAYIHTYKLIMITITQFSLICVLTQHPNSIQLFIIYVPSQKLQGQLQTQHSVNNSIQFNSLLFMC